MKRLSVALSWTIGVEIVWAAILFAAVMLIADKNWIGDNFLDPTYLRQSAMESYRNDMISAFLNAATAVFLIGVAASCVWHVSSAFRPIYGPGEAARLLWLWLLLLFIGGLLSIGAVYLDVVVATDNLVPNDGMFRVYGLAIVLFLLSYYFGTCFPTPPKLRPAVPLARFLPAI